MKHRITLDIELAELTDKERREMMALDMSGCDDPDDPENGLPTADDIDCAELGDLIASHLEYSNDEIWAGSEMYAEIVNVALVKARRTP